MADSPVSLEQFLQNRQRERDNNDYLRNSLSRAADVPDPDKYASQLADAQQYQLPVSAVESGQDDVRRQQFYDSIDIEDIRNNYPGTASFLAADPDNAILSRDSILGLKNLERALNEENFFERRANDFRRGMDRMQQGDAFGMIVLQSDNLRRLEELNQSLEEGEFDLQEYTRQAGFERAVDADEFARLSPEQRQAKIESVRSALDKSLTRFTTETEQMRSRPLGTTRERYERAEGFMGGLGEFLRSPIEIGTSIATESFAQYLPALPFMILGAPGAAVGGGMTSLMGEYQADMVASLQESGVDLTDREQLLNALQDEEALARWKKHATARSVPIALIDAISAGIAGRLTAAARTAGKSPAAVARTGAAEALLIQPGLGGLGEAAGSFAAGDPIDGKAILSEMIGELPTGTIETGVGFIDARADAARLTAQRAAADMLQSVGEQDQLDNWIEITQGTKLSQRAQDRFKNFLDGASKKFNSVYVSADAVRQLLEDGMILPDYLSTTDGITDIEVPIRTFLSEIATNEKLIEALRPHVKLSPNTQTRAQLTSKEGDETLRKIVERASKAGDTHKEADRIYRSIVDQLVATGRMNQTTARHSAQLIPAYVTTVAERYGIPVQEIYDRMNLSIRGPQAEQQSGATTLFEPGTPEFENLFGDSKVVDENGEPLMVYHGTSATEDISVFRVPAYFTNDPSFAGVFAGEQGATYPVYLSIENPYRIDGDVEGRHFEWDQEDVQHMESEGYDGVIVTSSTGANIYTVFRPEQIIFAIGNRDPNDRNILNQGPVPDESGMTVARIAAHFDREVLNKHGRRLDQQTDEDKAVVSDQIANEIAHALRNGTTSVDWYKKSIDAALQNVAEIYPEVATDPIARSAFVFGMAITSAGASVAENVSNAMLVYEQFRGANKFPEIGFGTARTQMAGSFAFANKLIEEQGLENFHRFLSEERTVRELKKMGYTVAKELMDTVVPTSTIFGPKIGRFYQNLMGNWSPVTMDRWFMRTWGRMTGTAVPDFDKAFPPRAEKLRAIIRKSRRKWDGYDRQALLTDDDVLLQFAQERYREFANNNFTDRSDLNRASKVVIDGLSPKIVPTNGTEMQWIREVMHEAQRKLRNDGFDTDMATMQAVLWYIEKDIYKAAGVGNARGESTDYEIETRKYIDDRLGRGTSLAGSRRSAGAATPKLAQSEAEAPKDGRAFRDFFAKVTTGETGRASVRVDYDAEAPVLQEQLDSGKGDLFDYHVEYMSHKGMFDDHIAMSIPGYRDHQYIIGNALIRTFDQPATMLDIGASEGTQAKTITSLSGGKISTVSLDPNPSMRDSFNSISKVPGATYAMEAFGFMPDDTGTAWQDGNETINWFDPGEQKFDIIQESMVFQFITSDRRQQIARVRDLLTDDGIAIIQEKVFTPWWDRNEQQKNKNFKSRYFSAADLDAKSAEVLEGMNKNMVSQGELESILRDNFKYVEQVWDSGNFKGYAASNSQERIGKFMDNLHDTWTPFDTRYRVDGGSFQPAVDAAKEYARISGIPYRPITTRARIDVDRAERIARAYEEMKHDPQNPKVKAAYEALINETIEQYRVILKTGVELHWIKDKDPYAKSPRLAIKDVVENNRLYVYPTRTGFGSNQSFDPSDNPLLVETEFMIDGEVMLANDVFRVVHDYFGHVKANAGFRAEGEENAWQQHAAMYSPLARQALTTETRGQNSFVNFGPHGEHNRTASSADTIYGDQKAGLMPEWTVEEGRIDTPTVREDDTILLTHYTDSDKLRFVDPKKYGTSLSSRGAESVRADMPNWVNRSFYGLNVGEEGGYRKEAGLGNNVYYATVKQGELYDYRRDPDKLFREDPDEFPEQNINDYERRIKRAGYKGYWVKDDHLGMVAAVFERLPASREVPQRRATLFQRTNDTSFPADELGLYSGLGRFVEEVNLPPWKKEDGQARGADVWAKISKAPLKKEELQWTGIEEFLTADPEAKFTRAAVMAYIRNNGVRIEEVRADQMEDDATIDWSRPEVWDDEEAYQHNIEDAMSEYDDGGSYGLFGDDIDTWLRDTWLEENTAGSRFFYSKFNALSDEQKAAREEVAGDNPTFADDLDWMRENGFPNIWDEAREAARDDYEDYATGRAREYYFDDPMYIQRADNIDLLIFGNDDIGYTINKTLEERRVVDDIFYSLNEAEIQALNYAVENGLISGTEGETVAKYGEYVMEGDHDNYRELKLTLPDIEDDFYYTSHFGDRNIMAFLRVTDRRLSDGSEPEVETTKKYPADTIRTQKGQPTSLHSNLIEVYSGDELLHTLATTYTPEQVKKVITEAKSGLSVGRYQTDGKGGLALTTTRVRKNKNTYFIDEFQSDWASVGRKGGFRPENLLERIDAANEKHKEARRAFAQYLRSLGPIKEDQFLDIMQSTRHAEDAGHVETIIQQTFVDEDVIEKITPLAVAYRNAHAEWLRLDSMQAVPPAPFVMNDNWLTLGLKRAIVDAVHGGHEAIAWPNSSTLESRWSSNYDYSSQYDKKMVSIVKKLTGTEPVQVGMDGTRILSEKEWRADKEVRPMAGETDMFAVYSKSGDDLVVGGFDTQESAQQWIDSTDPRELAADGYWIVPITDQLRERIQTEGGFPMFQQDRGSIELLDNQRIIRLSEASDASTFLHEAGHLFLEMEKQLAAKYGMSDMHRSILKFVGARSFDDIDPTTPEGVAMHEKFARAFEAYLREGKAPSLGLRDAFAAFSRWLKIIYRKLSSLNVTLDDEIRDVFDHMLATEAEIEAARANPAYDKFFESKEAAGMTDAQWRDHLKRVDEARNRAQGDIDSKLLKQLRDRRTAEWREEKQPLIDDALEQLSKEPVYKILAEASVEPMDYDQVIAIYGKLPGKMIGKARKGGIDPQEYAEVHGFRTVKEMLTAIDEAQPLHKAADAQAEQIMKDRHGDILNDGTLEQEVLNAMHNEAQAELMLEQLRVLNNQRRRKSNADEINREYLKAEAKRVVSTMTYDELNPNKYYRAEIRAAQNAVRETDPDKRFEFKLQQIVNHYLYSEASNARERMERQRTYIRKVQTRTYDSKVVDPAFIQNMKTLANLYDMRDKNAKVQAVESILNWYMAQINDPNQFVKVELMDPNLVLALEARERGEVASLNLPHFDDLTVDDLQGVYDMLRLMRHVGGKQGDQAKLEMAADRQKLRESIIDNGGRDVKGTRGAPDKWETMRRWTQHQLNRLPSLRNLIRRLDDTFDDPTATGSAWELLYKPIEQANSRKIGLNREMYERSIELFDGIHRIGLDRSANSSVTLVQENGNKWTFHSEHRFMLALYWGTESGRQAIRDGYHATDADVQAMLETLTTDQLRMVNKVWEFNESLWPDLSSVSVRVYGVAPPKLDPQPFLVNGIPMTGGHTRLYYDSQELELKTERDQAGMVNSIMPSKAGSLHARVGSGGRPPLLDKNNISRAMAENIHFIAFGEVGHRLNGLLSSKEVQGAIERKHGPGFYRALLQTVEGITAKRAERETDPLVAVLARSLRHAATFKHLAYSIRNTVQQITALFPVAHEIGTVNMVATYAEYLTPQGHRSIQEFTNERSEFMRDRVAVVNREASENLRQIAMPAGWTQAKWETYKRFGFAMQTLVDKHIAYPVWIAKYRQVMLETDDEARAISAADTAVAESVGSGSDLHLGGMFHSTNRESTRMFTVFGSWFNAYYQRIYRDTRGFSGWTNRSFGTLVSVPIMTAVASSLIIMDGPDEDEEWWQYVLDNYLSFMAGTIPVVRDIASVSKGFTPKSPLTSAVELPVVIMREFESGILDDDPDLLGSAIDATGAMTSVVPVPGSGQFLRMADYLESYYQGEEGEFNAYQMVVEGKDKNQ